MIDSQHRVNEAVKRYTYTHTGHPPVSIASHHAGITASRRSLHKHPSHRISAHDHGHLSIEQPRFTKSNLLNRPSHLRSQHEIKSGHSTHTP